MKGWITKRNDGEWVLWGSKPKEDFEDGGWYSLGRQNNYIIPKKLLPDLKFTGEPVYVELSIKVIK